MRNSDLSLSVTMKSLDQSSLEIPYLLKLKLTFTSHVSWKEALAYSAGLTIRQNRQLPKGPRAVGGPWPQKFLFSFFCKKSTLYAVLHFNIFSFFRLSKSLLYSLQRI